MKYWHYDPRNLQLVDIEPVEKDESFEAPVHYVTVEPNRDTYAKLKPFEKLCFDVSANDWYVCVDTYGFHWYRKDTGEGPLLIMPDHYATGNYTTEKPESTFQAFDEATQKWVYSPEKEYNYNIDYCLTARAKAYAETDKLKTSLEFDAWKQNKQLDLTDWYNAVDKIKRDFPKPVYGNKATFIYSKLNGL